jgi:hypothetical protein
MQLCLFYVQYIDKSRSCSNIASVVHRRARAAAAKNPVRLRLPPLFVAKKGMVM